MRALRLACFSLGALSVGALAQEFRPPAVPLVTHDPYLSIWSEHTRLTDGVTQHWTHTPHSLVSLIRVDGKTFRLMGNEPSTLAPLPQVGLEVTATRSIYKFKNDQISVELTFMSPALPSDLNIYARPVTYLTWKVASADGANHTVALYDSTSSRLAVDKVSEQVACRSSVSGSLKLLSAGAYKQTLFKPMGDDTRINWGYAYAVAPTSDSKSGMGDASQLESQFIQTGETTDMAFASNPADPVLAFSLPLGSVGATAVSRHLMIGYDEIYAIDYYGQPLRPYWRKKFKSVEKLFEAAEQDYAKLTQQCEAFDAEFTADATKVGGAKYAQILSLSYRECVAANGLAVDPKGQPHLLTKENTSNGDIATVDVFFPMDPLFIWLSPTLAKATLVSNFAYAASPHWKFPNAPHDLGTYPSVFGRDDGGEGMPVEESGNMIILTDAIAHAEHSAAFAKRWWPQLTQWAQYLEKYGLDPEDQLCTDDFMGHLAHNANLSVKAILALAAYGDLCRMQGDLVNAEKYTTMAKTDARHWVDVADEGDHSLLAFDRPNTWSQKYNLVWDKLLGLNVFPPEVARKEVAYYKKVMLPYGVPLDSRTHLTKTDWTIWSATMAESNADFEGFIDPIYRYLNETTTRDPIADSYVTDKVESGGMHARPVVGGFAIKMLSDPVIWNKWASRDHMKLGEYAPLPKPPVYKEIVATAMTAKVTWKYTTSKPAEGWEKAGFDDSGWSSGVGGFGTEGTPGAVNGTKWDTDDIWIRRSFVMPKFNAATLKLWLYHDDDVEVYVNGLTAVAEGQWLSAYTAYDIPADVLATLKPGYTVTIAAHCHQTGGGQGIDVGFAVRSRQGERRQGGKVVRRIGKIFTRPFRLTSLPPCPLARYTGGDVWSSLGSWLGRSILRRCSGIARKAGCSRSDQS